MSDSDTGILELADRVARLLAASDIDGAVALAESYATAQPAAAELGRAAIAMYRSDVKQALAHATQAKLLGGGAAAEQYLATTYLVTGDRDRALASARAAVALDDSARVRSTLGSILLASGRIDEADAVLRKVVTDDPDNRDAHVTLAMAAYQRADYGTAMKEYARAFELDPHDRRPLHQLAEMFAEMGKWLGAVAALELSRQGEPPADVAVALDLVLLEITGLIAEKFPAPKLDDKSDATVARLVANAQRRPATTQLVIARAMIDIERYPEAKRLARELAKQELATEERAELAYVEGLLAERDREPLQAIDAYDRALVLDRERADAAVNAVSLLLAEGSGTSLERIAAILDRVSPVARANHPPLLFNEAVYLLRAGRVDEGRAKLELVAQRSEGKIADLARRALAELS